MSYSGQKVVTRSLQNRNGGRSIVLQCVRLILLLSITVSCHSVRCAGGEAGIPVFTSAPRLSNTL